MQPPDGWPHHVRRGLPFPPGVDDQAFDIIACPVSPGGEIATYHMNVESGAVFAETPTGWDQPPWHELPEFVRREVWHRRVLTALDANA